MSELYRALEARDRAVEEIRRMSAANAKYLKTLFYNHVFAGNCAVTLTEVGELRGKISAFCTASYGFSDIWTMYKIVAMKWRIRKLDRIARG